MNIFLHVPRFKLLGQSILKLSVAQAVRDWHINLQTHNQRGDNDVIEQTNDIMI